jgi:hypothetical protein
MNLMHQKKSLIKMMIHQYKQILINQNGHPFDLNNLPLMMKVTTETTGTEKCAVNQLFIRFIFRLYS